MNKRRKATLYRSEEKKSDQKARARKSEKKEEKRLSKSPLLKGRVLSIQSEIAECEHEGLRYQCVLRGILKKERKREQALLAPGDFVNFEKKEGNSGVIISILPRHSILSRSDLQGKKEKIIAVNVDLALITITLVDPTFRPHFLDRTIMASKKGDLHPVIVVNKIDLIASKTPESEKLEEIMRIYPPLGIPVILVSADLKIHIDHLEEIMKGKTSVFVGESGVGKSSLINAIAKMDLPVQEISLKTKRGVHTTTSSALICIAPDTWCVDTPGIQKLGFWNLSSQDVKSYFPEFNEYESECRYSNCTHTHEPDCAVQEALSKGLLHPMRYESYVSLVRELEN